MPARLINLVSFSSTTDAYLLVAKLETEGIACFLRNEHIQLTQQLAHAFGGIDVQVREDDFDRAKGIIADLEKDKLEDREKYYVPTGFEKAWAYCPECESSEVYRKKPFFFSLSAAEYYCCACHYLWKE